MKPNEFAFEVFTPSPTKDSLGAVLFVADTSRYSVADDEHVLRLDIGVFLGSVDDVENPTTFHLGEYGADEEIELALPLKDKFLKEGARPVLIYSRNWDGCQHVHWTGEYDHICEAEVWHTLCFALNALPDWSQEALGPAWIDYKVPN